jgi:beta-ring hydroxylase
VWKARRRVVVPSLHRKYIASMTGMFGDCAVQAAATLQHAHQVRRPCCRV